MNLLKNASFDVDKSTHTLRIKRAFSASRARVWATWTTPELLDQWWAPKPYRTETKSMDFQEGGEWLYAMISPEGDVHWCKATYTKIEPEKRFSHTDAFCDDTGKENEVKPVSHWTTRFSETDGVTTVDVTLSHDSLEDLETMIEMGFREGFLAALGNLNDILS